MATLTFFSANHCPGAVGLLLQGYFGTILHTGDFRFSPEMLEHTPQLRSAVFDTVYLDNTYCHPRHEFPSREEVAEQILQLIAEHHDKRVIIGVDLLGKEELLVYLATALKTRVVVSSTRYQNLRLLDLDDVFDPLPTQDSFIFVVSKNELSREKSARLLFASSFCCGC